MLRQELAPRRHPTEENARVVMVLAASVYSRREKRGAYRLDGDLGGKPVHKRRHRVA